MARTTCALFSFACALTILFPPRGTMCAQERRAIVPSDCVTVRHFLEKGLHPSIQIDPQGTKAAYLVQSPNLQTNQNEVDLDVVSVATGEPRHLLVGRGISELHWIDQGNALAILAQSHHRVSVVKVSVSSGRVDVLARVASDISEYSISEDGKVIVFAVDEKQASPVTQPTAEQEARGYRIPFERQSASRLAKRELFVTRKTPSGWTAPFRLAIHLPWMAGTLESFPYLLDLRLSLSPDGRSLALTYMASPTSTPAAWKESAEVRDIDTSVGVVQLTAVVDLKTGKATLPLESPWEYSVPFWSRDSRSFVIMAVSPVNSVWAYEEENHHRQYPDIVHQFEVTVSTGKVHMVQSAIHSVGENPLSWDSDGELLVRTADDTLSRMRFESDAWRETAKIHLPISSTYRNAELVSDGKVLVGDYETPSTPPGLFIFRAGSHGLLKRVSLNPQFERLTLAAVREMQWDTSTGYHASGLLFVPPDYDSHKAYPLVIHSYPASSNFFCDSGVNHEPSFAPQPLANAGIMYLIRIHTIGSSKGEEQAHYPSGYPGMLAEPAFEADVWDSAVEKLSAEGLIDPEKIGIIGFSHSGWLTQFALTNGRTHYAAATIADNVQYSLGEYWIVHSDGILKGWDAMFGGPPYGDTLQNWLKYSISFNIPKIHTPLLMEVMGYGKRFTDAENPPANLATRSEVFTGLNRLHRPVELYYYPFESHQPDDPLARLASLERNLDWYEFWLKGVERPDEADPGQYTRWREFRKSYEAENAMPSPQRAH